MLKLRVREYTPAGVRGRVLPADEIIHTDNENGTATLSFSLSTKMAGRLDTPFVVGVEYAVDKGLYSPVSRNDLFIMDEDSGDDADSAKTVKFSGEAACLWLMQRNHAWWNERTKDNVREFHSGGNPVSAGFVMRELIDSSIAYGWAPQFKTDFSGTVDSAGQAWHADEKTKFPVNVPSSLSKVVGSLAEQGLAEFATAGFTLRMYRPGTTRDRTNVVLGGPRFERIPVKVSAKQMYSVLAVLPDGLPDFTLPVPGADMRFGKLDGLITQSGVSDLATAHRLAQPQVALGNRASREEGYEWTPAGNDFVPWRDFQVGDTVSARSRGGKLSRRVIGLVTRMQAGGATVRAIVGERVGSDSIRFAKKLSTVGVGGVAGGTGAAFPVSPGVPSAAPDRPAGLVEVSNSGSWGDDGTAHSAVGLSWAAVTATTLGTEADVAHYEVWSRLPSGELAFDTQVTGTSATITSWEPGRLRLVVVYAISTRGVRSVASLELPVTPVMPASLVPRAPVGLAIDSNVGAFTDAGPVASVVLSFTPVTLSVDGEPVEIGEYEVWDASGPLRRFPAAAVTLSIPSGVVRDLRVRAMSVNGVWGDLSSVLAVTGALPSVVSRAPSDPVMTTSMGNAFAMWNGEYTAGGAGAHTVRVEARVGTTGDFVQQAVLTGPTNQLIRLGGKGDTVQVRFRAYDQLGRLTGTSATKSVVVEGVPFTSFDDAAQDRIIDTETAVAAVETGQAAIGRTVDGLNRLFQSMEAPKRGKFRQTGGTVEVFENLAPKIEGSGVWAEIRRNRCRVPQIGTGQNGTLSANTTQAIENSGGPEYCPAWRKAVVHTSTAGNYLKYDTDVGTSGTPVSGATTYYVRASTYSETPRVRGLRVYTYGSGGVSTGSFPAPDSGYVSGWHEIAFSLTVPAGAAYMMLESAIRAGAGVEPVIGEVFGYSAFMISDSDGPYFDGDTPDFTVDPDMRQRWLGAENASESVMEIQNVKDFVTNEVIAGVSTWEGGPAVRLIATDVVGAAPWAGFIVPVSARGSRTLVGTVHQTEPMPSPSSPLLRGVLSFRQPTIYSDSAPNEAGSTTLRLETAVPFSSTYQARLGHGGAKGSPDVWWTDIGLYAGSLPEDAQSFHNGDEWRRLDWMPGENPGDPDRLVIVEILVWDGQDWVSYDIWAQNVFAAGSVTTRLLNATEIRGNQAFLDEAFAGTLSVDMLQPNFGDNLNLSGNAVHINLTQRVDAAVSELAAQADQIADAAAVAAAAATPAEVQQEINTLAQGRVLTAEQALAVLSSKIDTYENSFSFESDGLHIREAQTASAEMILAAAGMRLNADGATVAEINQGQMIIAQIMTSGGRLGTHLVDSSIVGHTTWRLPSA